MHGRLHSTCQLADGHHWLLSRSDGHITATSQVGFPTAEDALKDLGVLKRDN
jgi:hypothetical protein